MLKSKNLELKVKRRPQGTEKNAKKKQNAQTHESGKNI